MGSSSTKQKKTEKFKNKSKPDDNPMCICGKMGDLNSFKRKKQKKQTTEGMDTVTMGYPFNDKRARFIETNQFSDTSSGVRRLNPNHGIVDQYDIQRLMTKENYSNYQKKTKGEGFIYHLDTVDFRPTGCLVTSQGEYMCDFSAPTYKRSLLYPATL